MKHHVMLSVLGGVALLAAVTAGFCGGHGKPAGDGVAIRIAPKTLCLSAPVPCVTVHTNIPFGEADNETLTLNGIEPYLVKADNLGLTVAKLRAQEIKALVPDGATSLTLTLTGVLTDGTAFAAPDTLRIVK